MVKNQEDNLINSLKSQTEENLSMTGMPVLVQNQLGIFYGKLEKADTRKGTALLTNGYAIDPQKHLTFTQYLRFLNTERKGNKLTADGIRKIAQRNTITDYATEGIAVYYVDVFDDDTGYLEAPNGIDPIVGLLSLTGIYAIVSIADDTTTTYLWNDMASRNEQGYSGPDDLDITVSETFLCIGDIGRGLDGETIVSSDGGVDREVKYSSALIRPLVVKESM